MNIAPGRDSAWSNPRWRAVIKANANLLTCLLPDYHLVHKFRVLRWRVDREGRGGVGGRVCLVRAKEREKTYCMIFGLYSLGL